MAGTVSRPAPARKGFRWQNESVSPPGSHKPNNAVAQAWYNKEFGYSGHGLMDLAGYQAFFAGDLENHPPPVIWPMATS